MRKTVFIFLAAFFFTFTLLMNVTNIVTAVELESEQGVEKNNNELDREIEKSDEQLREEIEANTKEESMQNIKIDEEHEGDKGDLYNTYKEKFDEIEDKQAGGKMYVDMMKKLNYTDGKFECGKFDVVCHVTNLFYITGGSVIAFVLEPMTKLAIKPSDIVNDNTFNEFKDAFQTFTTSLLAVFIIFQVLKIYIFRMTNHLDTGNVLNEKIIKIVFACIFLFTYDMLFQFILNIQYRVNYGIFSHLTASNELMNNILINFLFVPSGLSFLLMILIYAILLFVLFIQMLYSFALIALFYVVGPVAITTMVNDEYNMFGLWLKTIISRFLTLSLQGLCVVLTFKYGANIDFITNEAVSAIPENPSIKTLSAMAFLLVGLGLPSLMKQFGSSSGAGRGAIAGVKSVTRVFRG